jgi:membrane fusion protein (multidrug efflux system)
MKAPTATADLKAAEVPAPSPAKPTRWLRVGGGALLALGLLAGGGSEVAGLHAQQTTEDAFVGGNVVAVTAQVGGVATAINADDTDSVEAGNVLVQLDDIDAQLALDRAKAQLAQTVRQVRTRFAAARQSGAAVALRRIDLARAQADLNRRQELRGSGAVSGEEVEHAEQAVRAAAAALDQAGAQQGASQALVDHLSVPQDPDVMAAAAQLRDAWIAVYRTRVPAPVSGVVGKRNVQLGQKISPGVALMSVVPLDHLWVEANFKESQLGDIRIGQPVTLTADLYGGRVSYRGTVLGQQAGTGGAFALLPAQNATGNWIKVVQRVPVRISLDPAQVSAHPLQLGLSMKVTVDTAHQDGPRLTSAAGGPDHGEHTDVYANPLARADAVVRQVIQANL